MAWKKSPRFREKREGIGKPGKSSAAVSAPDRRAGRPPDSRQDAGATRTAKACAEKLYELSPNNCTCRVSDGMPLRRRRVAPITASTVSDSSASRGTKIR